tara:strand:+ start:549 stop:1385 length:837 start_codon:yes stop_codon:yes gene_type:complete
MSLDYTTKIDESSLLICATDPENGNYVETPIPPSLSESGRQDVLMEIFEALKAEAIYKENIQPDFARNFRDHVYMDGEIKRTDFSADRPEALAAIESLIAVFPEYTVDHLTRNPKNVIGEYGNYRPPYSNNSISFYDFTKPAEATLEAYGCTVETYGDDLLQWHGIKHDMSTLTKSAKFVFTQNYGAYIQNEPASLPRYLKVFYAKIHNSDGTVSPWVDIYLISTINAMRKWCSENGLTFPLPDDITEQPWCFAVVYNDETGEMNCVKAYIRHRYSDE